MSGIDPLLKIADVAERLGSSTKHVGALIKRGDLKACRLPGRTGTRGLIRIPTSALNALLDKSADWRTPMRTT
jgi:hypothetical protein